MLALLTHFHGLTETIQLKLGSPRTEPPSWWKKRLEGRGSSQVSALYDYALPHWLIVLLEDRMFILQKVRGQKNAVGKNKFCAVVS